MLKKRLIFTLHIDGGNYMLSRNFDLQEVGDLQWIKDNYDFESISTAIDELVVLNVARGRKDVDRFCKELAELTKTCFMPVAAGGGIRSMEHAEKILNNGADKLVVNTVLLDNPELVKELVKRYGSQCVIASIDFKREEDIATVWRDNGSMPTGKSINEMIAHVNSLDVGEILLTSIDKDGTGMGYDVDATVLASKTQIPVIPSGGAGKYQHFLEAFRKCRINAVSTANLFNFMSDGIKDARQSLMQEKVQLAEWIR